MASRAFGAYLSVMSQSLPRLCAAALCALTLTAPPAGAQSFPIQSYPIQSPSETPQGEGPLPSERELRELGALAERLLRDFGERLAPMGERLRELVDDLDSYEAPEMLPNGDIIIRRKPDAPELPDPKDGVAL